MNRPITSKEFESVIKPLQGKVEDKMASLVNSTKHLRRINTHPSQTVLKN